MIPPDRKRGLHASIYTKGRSSNMTKNDLTCDTCNHSVLISWKERYVGDDLRPSYEENKEMRLCMRFPPSSQTTIRRFDIGIIQKGEIKIGKRFTKASYSGYPHVLDNTAACHEYIHKGERNEHK